ncbi:MAG TPA: RsmD family RNA methyltransferase, partial [Candidatus Acidoferrum sp.]|nr:RsmD family RNA methyltransferase [Candidatus Acidoferrum sp.]
MKLKITSGTLRSRQFETPGTETTHPMGERVRLALFNSLGDISGQTILDPFAGSGALSFEALSRGASHATLIERDRLAQKIIQANAEKLGLTAQTTIINGSSQTWSAQNPGAQFDLILCDPPYGDVQPEAL